MIWDIVLYIVLCIATVSVYSSIIASLSVLECGDQITADSHTMDGQAGSDSDNTKEISRSELLCRYTWTWTNHRAPHSIGPATRPIRASVANQLCFTRP